MYAESNSSRSPRPVSRHDIRAYRRSLGVDQTSFATIMGVNQATVSRWESGRTPIDQGRCRRVLQHLELAGLAEKHIVPFENVNVENHWPTLLKLYRQTRGISQMLLAEILDVDVTTIYRWENGVFPPGLREQAQLRDLLLRPLSLNAVLPNLKQRISDSSQSVSLAYGYIWIAFSERVRKLYLTMGLDIQSNPSLSPYEGIRTDDSRVIHSSWMEERLRAGFWRGEVPLSRCNFRIDDKTMLRVAAIPLCFEDGISLTMLQSRIVNDPAPDVSNERSFNITHMDEIIG